MQLDTTILQTRTVEELVEFIDELFEIAGNYRDYPMNDFHTHEHVTGRYEEIKNKFYKAQQRRTSRYGKEKAFVDLDE